ncbi:NADP-dependent oxidoreductase [Pedobacter hartonius]|nr:NADP-dependent oxidoreductase [Pedobacter hartonius]
MKAIIIAQAGGTAELQIREIPVPHIQNGEVLIQVKAISINPVDTKTRKGNGQYSQIKDDHPIILGWDVSGVVSQSKSDLFNVGDEVFGMVNFPGHGKAYAEFVASPATHLALKPGEISHEEAAAATLAALTAYQSLVNTARIQAGQKILIHAAAGGVGHFAVQIAKHFGAYVAGTSSAKNKDFVLNLGADEHIDYHTTQLEEHAKDFDMVLDTIGGDNIDRSLTVIKQGGILISIPSGLNDSVGEKSKAKGVSGYTFKVASNGKDMQVIADYLKQGIIKAHVSETLSFEEMAIAHEQLESGRTVGKVVISLINEPE